MNFAVTDKIISLMVIVMIVVSTAMVAIVIARSIRQRNIDRGRCLRSHIEHRRAWVQQIQAGKIPILVHHPARTVTVCDEWEFPKGRPFGEFLLLPNP